MQEERAESVLAVGQGLAHLEHLDVLVVARDLLGGYEAEAEKLLCRVEDCLLHGLQGQVGLEERFVKVVFGKANALGIVAPVPRL